MGYGVVEFPSLFAVLGKSLSCSTARQTRRQFIKIWNFGGIRSPLFLILLFRNESY